MSAMYPLWKRALLTGAANADLDENTAQDGYYCALIQSGMYSFSALHEFYTSLTGVLGTDQLIANVSIANSTTDGDDVMFTTIPAATAIGAIVTYRRNAGGSGTWRLVHFYDGPGLPAISAGGPVTVQWNPVGIHTL